MQLHLFHLPGACSRVTLTALRLTGAPFEVTTPAMHRGGLSTPEFRRLNPLGQVPVLLIDGKPYTENVAILFTLARLFPEAKLLPLGDPLTEARAISRLAFCSSQLHPCVTRIMFPERFCDTSPEAAARVREQSIAMLTTRLSVVEPVLSGQPWWLGEEPTIADVYLLWITGRLLQIGIDFSALPSVVAHVERTRRLDAVQWVMAQEALRLAELEADGLVLPPHVRASIAPHDA